MIEFILSMLASPESQADPHYWVAVGLAHSLLGLGLMAVLAWPLGGHWALISVGVLYFIWETLQLIGVDELASILALGDFSDFAVDWLFVMGGAVIGWATWQRRAWIVAGVMAGLGVLSWMGIKKRK